MRANKDKKTRTATTMRPSSPPRRRTQTTTTTTPSASVLDSELLTEEETTTFFRNLQISSPDSSANPRSFPYSVKQQCWEKAEKVRGRDPDRWRRDALGNIVFRKLVGCPGCLCHDYDHILPYSKATVNRSKGNRTELSRAELIQKSSYCRVAGRDMDLIELSAYGNVRRGQDTGGCRIQ